MSDTLKFDASSVHTESVEDAESIAFEDDRTGTSFMLLNEEPILDRKKRSAHAVRAWWHQGGKGADERIIYLKRVHIAPGRFQAEFEAPLAEKGGFPFHAADITFPDIDLFETAEIVGLFRELLKNKIDLVTLDIPGMPAKLLKINK